MCVLWLFLLPSRIQAVGGKAIGGRKVSNMNDYEIDWFALPRRYWIWLLALSLPIGWLKGGTDLLLNMLFCYVIASILAWGAAFISPADSPEPGLDVSHAHGNDQSEHPSSD